MTPTDKPDNNHDAQRHSLTDWLGQCADIAMQSEWCIDPSWPRWQHLYDEGLSPEAAIDELFEQVRRLS